MAETMYVLLLEAETPCGRVATIEAVYADQGLADKHAAIINGDNLPVRVRARVQAEPIQTQDRWPMLPPFLAAQPPAREDASDA